MLPSFRLNSKFDLIFGFSVKFYPKKYLWYTKTVSLKKNEPNDQYRLYIKANNVCTLLHTFYAVISV